MRSKRFAALGGALLVVLAIVVVALRPSHETAEARAQRLERHIACPVCVGESVAESNSDASLIIRSDIEARIRRGQSDSEILGYYAKHYPKQQLNPSDGGIGLVAWGLPVVAVVLAVAGLGVAMVRWKRVPRMVATTDDEVLVQRARRRA